MLPLTSALPPSLSSRPDFSTEKLSESEIKLFERLYALIRKPTGSKNHELQLICLNVLVLEPTQIVILGSILALFNYQDINTPLNCLVENSLYIDAKMLIFSMDCALKMSAMTPRISKQFFLGQLGNYICENQELWRDERSLILEIYAKFSKTPFGENGILAALCYIALHVPYSEQREIAAATLFEFSAYGDYCKKYRGLSHPVHWWREVLDPELPIFYQSYLQWVPSINIVGEIIITDALTSSKVKAYVVKEFRINKIHSKRFEVVFLPSGESLGDLELRHYRDQIGVERVYSYFSTHNPHRNISKVYKFVGTALIQIACEYAQRKKTSFVRLNALIEAIPFYQKMGFDLLRPIDESKYSPEITSTMELDKKALASWLPRIISHPILYKTSRMRLTDRLHKVSSGI